MEKETFVIYKGCNGETIITTAKYEKEMLKEFFGKDTGPRKPHDYDREVVNDCAITAISSVEVG